MRWFEQARQDWIFETLTIFGFIQRKHLMRKFDISEPQASADLAKFQRRHPLTIKYDKSEKRYVWIQDE
jgi:DeoR/GlpR family transcriptional regulator of sugar metabolism